MSLNESEKLENDFNVDSNNNECSICLDDINNGQPIRVLDCEHIIHRDCVEKWINIYSTCPYCRQCEKNIECYWLWLKPYNLSWINKRFKYKYTLKKGYFEITRKKQVHTVNLYTVKHVHVRGNIITFTFYNNRKFLLWFKDAYGPFNELYKELDKLALQRRQQREREYNDLQVQIQSLLLEQYENNADNDDNADNADNDIIYVENNNHHNIGEILHF